MIITGPKSNGRTVRHLVNHCSTVRLDRSSGLPDCFIKSRPAWASASFGTRSSDISNPYGVYMTRRKTPVK